LLDQGYILHKIFPEIYMQSEAKHRQQQPLPLRPHPMMHLLHPASLELLHLYMRVLPNTQQLSDLQLLPLLLRQPLLPLHQQ
jgi:hypothetical protein